jgi:dynein light chain LC8-type
MAERKAVIKNADMSEDMQQDAVDCASQALEKYNIEKVKFIFKPFLIFEIKFYLSYLEIHTRI